ncbi:MAG TPA: TldD/PmbA family protein [Thermodesulfovibrionales bacterium]|nr:TldD/PmbA family protein [Thermodesulfovibrionales bacterium]
MKTEREFAFRLLEEAKKKGAEFAEVYLKSARNLSAEVKDQETDAVESSIDFGYSLRVIRKKRLGFSYATDLRKGDSVVEDAVEASKWAEEDDYLALPEPSPQQSMPIFDDAVASVGKEEAVIRACATEKAARVSDARITKVRKSSASFTCTDVLIMNSRGLDAMYSSTSATAEIMVVAEEGGDSQMGWDFEGSRFLGDVSPEAVGKRAAARALEMLGARKIRSVSAQVMLDSSVAADFLGIFSSLLSSESVQKGKSLLAKRIDEEVVSPRISIVDDGGVPRKLGSRPCDDEGVATSKKELIQDGVLLGYLYNTYTAKKDGVASTGNAVKGGFSLLPSVGRTNLYLTGSSLHPQTQNLPAQFDRGLFVTDAMGMHTANRISGEFSIGVSGLWIEGGKARHAVKEAVISGNILEFFRNVEAVGDDLRFYGNIGAPSLLIGPVDISA